MNNINQSSCVNKKSLLSLIGKTTRYFFLVTVLFVTIILLTVSSNEQEVTTHVNTDPTNISVGEEGYVRLPGIADTESKICLGETQKSSSAITDALLAKDYIGLSQIPGLFCVTNGTKVLLIEKDFPLRKVRILNGEMIGRAGWVDLEWVVNQ